MFNPLSEIHPIPIVRNLRLADTFIVTWKKTLNPIACTGLVKVTKLKFKMSESALYLLMSSWTPCHAYAGTC